MKKKYVFKWHRNPFYISLLHLISFLMVLVMLIGFFEEDTAKIAKNTFLILIITISLINLILFIYSYFFGWNRAIYFCEDCIWQKINGKLYEWRWDNMSECKLVPMEIGICFVYLETSPEYKKLTFTISGYRYKKLKKLCSNAKIKEQLREFFED